jgi:nucleotide-binding universal stress UspA family protein
MYRKILLATDLTEVSENALVIALNLARRHRARLHVLHALESPYVLYRGLVGDRLTGKLRQADAEYIAEVSHLLEQELADKLEGFEDYAALVREGIPFVEILKLAKKEAADLIVMGPHTGRAEERGVTRAGSTMLRVAAKARCPVMVVGGLEWRGIRDTYEHVLFASDLSAGCRAALKTARATAEAYGARLSLFHALALSPLPGEAYPSQETIEERLRVARERLRETCAPELAGLDGWQAACWEGVPFVEIVKYAREHAADLIVLGPHAGAETERPGNTIEQVGLRAGCPVLVVPR